MFDLQRVRTLYSDLRLYVDFYCKYGTYSFTSCLFHNKSTFTDCTPQVFRIGSWRFLVALGLIHHDLDQILLLRNQNNESVYQILLINVTFDCLHRFSKQREEEAGLPGRDTSCSLWRWDHQVTWSDLVYDLMCNCGVWTKQDLKDANATWHKNVCACTNMLEMRCRCDVRWSQIHINVKADVLFVLREKYSIRTFNSKRWKQFKTNNTRIKITVTEWRDS